MTIKLLILDLDQTLVESSAAEAARKARDWRKVYSTIPRFSLYPGLVQLVLDARANGCKVAIVTSSPGTYCDKVLSHFGVRVDARVAYHDTQRRKPHPDPILRALSLSGVDADDAVAVGDAGTDTASARAAGVQTIGAAWASGDLASLLDSEPDHMCRTPEELVALVRDMLEDD